MKEDKTLYALEIPVFGDNFDIANDSFRTDDIVDMIDMAHNADIVGLKFNISSEFMLIDIR